MNYTYTIILINLLIWGSWIWRYHVYPYYLKQSIKAQLSHHPDGDRYKQIDRFLTAVFNNTRSRWISRHDRRQLNKLEDGFTYGEVDCLSFMTILDKTHPKPGERFVDLGSGAGKAVMTAAITFDLGQSIGVELLPSLCELAKEKIKKARIKLTSDPSDFAQISLERLTRIEIITDDFLHVDLTHCDILFVNATCLNALTWQTIQKKLSHLKVGSRVIVTTKKILDDAFQLTYQGRTLMSWGMNSIYIYTKC